MRAATSAHHAWRERITLSVDDPAEKRITATRRLQNAGRTLGIHQPKSAQSANLPATDLCIQPEYRLLGEATSLALVYRSNPDKDTQVAHSKSEIHRPITLVNCRSRSHHGPSSGHVGSHHNLLRHLNFRQAEQLQQSCRQLRIERSAEQKAELETATGRDSRENS